MRDHRLIRNARVNRQAMGEAERYLWYELRHRALGVRFRRQHPIARYIADFACIQCRIVVEVDGSQHIGSSYDRQRDRDMAALGWRVLRFWAWDVIRDMDSVIDTIAHEVDRRCPHPPRRAR